MENYEVVKTDMGYVVYVKGKYYPVPTEAARMSKDELKTLLGSMTIGGIQSSIATLTVSRG
jgi:hypothetical protein